MELSNKIRDRIIIKQIVFFSLFFFISWGVFSQTPHHLYDLQLKGTRSWIKVNWKTKGKVADSIYLFWSTEKKRPQKPAAVVSGKKEKYYILEVQKKTTYYVWIATSSSSNKENELSGKVFTKTQWSLEPDKRVQLSPTSSKAVPEGMELYWHDEFNDLFLNRNKWFPTYYSTIDFLRKEAWEELQNNNLPEAAYHLNGSYIDLFVNDSLPKKAFFMNGKKVSSIQTYDWATNESLLDNSLGGYFEVRVRRGSIGKVEGLNTAFWFDAPGPDLKYYLPENVVIDSIKGIRPRGQLFEIDMFEYLNAQFVIHGRVDSTGKFVHNLVTDVAQNYKPRRYRPGKRWATFGLLWTPVSIKHYINGRLIKSYDNKTQIFSPNHFMNVLLGSYGKGGSVNLQVDYIRYYRWPTSVNNELPNPDFEANKTMLPWQGTGQLSAKIKKNGKYGVLLKPNQNIEQYVYLENKTEYLLSYWAKGPGYVSVEVDNIQEVTGVTEEGKKGAERLSADFSKRILKFKTMSLPNNHKKTIRIKFENKSSTDIWVDHIKVKKR